MISFDSVFNKTQEASLSCWYYTLVTSFGCCVQCQIGSCSLFFLFLCPVSPNRELFFWDMLFQPLSSSRGSQHKLKLPTWCLWELFTGSKTSPLVSPTWNNNSFPYIKPVCALFSLAVGVENVLPWIRWPQRDAMSLIHVLPSHHDPEWKYIQAHPVSAPSLVNK